MPQRTDHRYPLAPALTLAVSLDTRGGFVCQDALPEGTCVADMTWMLAVDYRASGRWALPGVTTWQGERECFTQYLEPNEAGARLINLTGITRLDNICLVAKRCRLAPRATLLGFMPPALSDEPLLILAPHPDDAELAAYGLYQRHAQDSWIVTLTAGERQKRLDQQYLPGLDGDAASASRRKGEIRAWNSATTPQLAGVTADRLIMLGYFNDTLTTLLAEPDQDVPSIEAPDLTPALFRRWNTRALPTDSPRDSLCGQPLEEGPRNRGADLLEDLIGLIEHIRPGVVVVTHPEIDPHPDHRATARALALALAQTQHQPREVLLYANHLKGVRGFPRGPAHAAAGVWPLDQQDSGFGPWRLYSETLDDETIRQKAVALHSMHDLHVRVNLDKRLKRGIARRLGGLPADAWKDYGPHDYFQTHLKAHEVFAVIDTAMFVARFSA
ncbi:MAG: PIG-L family deacetylase [Halomonas subglaciescola]|nr:PIG-L family deacetylase [Halomonas subglaciescola]